MKAENLQKSVLVFQCYFKRLLGHCTDPDLKIGEDWTATLNAIESLLNWAKSITTFFPLTLRMSNTRCICPSSNLGLTIDSIGEQRPSSLTSITYWPTLENSTKPIHPSFALLRPPPNCVWRWSAIATLSKFQPITRCSQQILKAAHTVRFHQDIRLMCHRLLRLPMTARLFPASARYPLSVPVVRLLGSESCRILTRWRKKTENWFTNANFAIRRSASCATSRTICGRTRANVRSNATFARSVSRIHPLCITTAWCTRESTSATFVRIVSPTWATLLTICGCTRLTVRLNANFAPRVSPCPLPCKRIWDSTRVRSRTSATFARNGSPRTPTSSPTSWCTPTSGPTRAVDVKWSSKAPADCAFTKRRPNASTAVSRSGHLPIQTAPMWKVIFLNIFSSMAKLKHFCTRRYGSAF